MKLIVDTHSHTLASGHAYSTIREMALAAKERGMKALAITEHAPKMPSSCGLFYFMNLGVLPREMYGVGMLFGTEVNIMNPQGGLDLPEHVLKDMDVVVASMHTPCFGEGHTMGEVMDAYLAVMRLPYVNIVGHPDDGRFPMDYERLVKAAKETHTLLELNNSSLRPQSVRAGARENVLTMLDLCRQYEVPVTTGSDAHVDVDAGNFCYVQEILEYCHFPEELVVTTDLEKLKPYLNHCPDSSGVAQAVARL